MPHILSNISNFTIFICFKDTREVYKVTLEKIKNTKEAKADEKWKARVMLYRE